MPVVSPHFYLLRCTTAALTEKSLLGINIGKLRIRRSGSSTKRPMRNPKEYRANAAKCAEWAAYAKSPSARQTFLDLAQTWQNLALETEAFEASVTDEDEVAT